jgi:RNA polymerase sigma factor (sigma-70 family)
MFVDRNYLAGTVSLGIETSPSLEESLEASALTHASHRGLLARRSPLLKLQGDAKLIAMVREGNVGAFETIVDRYQGRLLGFCRQMLSSTEDAEDVLQEVFVNAQRAMLRDEREINLRPWLYRIARNRCLNHLRKPTADAQESMDMVPAVEASSTAERVHNREEFRQILTDVNKLPETQRSALLLREMDALSYEEIAQAMDTSVPSVKSLLVRARISLTEASQARQLTCGEVRLELAEAAEGLRKVSGPVRRHVRDCEECADFRSQIRSSSKALAALFPVGPLIALKGFIASKLGLGGAGAGGAGTAGAAAGGAAGTAGAVSGVGAALGGGSAAGGLGAVGGAIGTKAVAGVVTAAVLTAGAAVEVKQENNGPVTPEAPVSRVGGHQPHAAALSRAHSAEPKVQPVEEAPPVPPLTPVEAAPTAEPAKPPVEPVAEEPAPTAPPTTEPELATVEAGQSTSGEEGVETGTGLTAAEASAGSGAGAHGSGSTVVVTVGGAPPVTPPPAPAPAPEPPPAAPPTSEPSPASGTSESAPPAESSAP